MSDRTEAKVRADFKENIMQYEYWLCSLQMLNIFGKSLYEARKLLTSEEEKKDTNTNMPFFTWDSWSIVSTLRRHRERMLIVSQQFLPSHGFKNASAS
jgi:hypothetical protein